MKKLSLHSIVVLIGPTKSGKSTWAQNQFDADEIISLASIKKELTGNNSTVDILPNIWHELYRRVDIRIANGQRAVVDSTNLKDKDRFTFLDIAEKYGVEVYYKPFDLEWGTIQQNSGSCYDFDSLRKSYSIWKNARTQVLQGDNKRAVVLCGDETTVGFPNELQSARILAVGDVHGNFPAMQQAVQMAQQLHAKLVWLGDIVDYGANNLKCLKLAYDTVRDGQALMIWGNHERKIDRWIRSDLGETFNGKLSESNLSTIREINSLNDLRKKKFLAAWTALRNWSFNHLTVGKFLFTHGAATPAMWANKDRRLQGVCANMAYFGEVDTVSPTKNDGYPNRIWNWVQNIPAEHTVVVGHDWLDRVSYNVVEKANSCGGRAFVTDCGSSKGGRLAALFVDQHSKEVLPYYFDT
jgi:hypothetical protein